MVRWPAFTKQKPLEYFNIYDTYMIIIWLIYRIIIDPSMDTDLSKMLTVETDQIQLPMLVTCILTLYNHYYIYINYSIFEEPSTPTKQCVN